MIKFINNIINKYKLYKNSRIRNVVWTRPKKNIRKCPTCNDYHKLIMSVNNKYYIQCTTCGTINSSLFKNINELIEQQYE